jgi:hypothetical protein
MFAYLFTYGVLALEIKGLDNRVSNILDGDLILLTN